VQVDYDPNRITYSRLLDLFWKGHSPTQKNWSRQYMNAVFYQNDDQKKLALESKAQVENTTGGKVRTQIVPMQSFTLAEDYHQKYLLKRRQDLKNELLRVYPNPRDFVDSTAVTRLNGYVGGHGSPTQLSREIESLGLSNQAKQSLNQIVR
jgi:peptide methionine sulfoxide reductase MsrA